MHKLIGGVLVVGIVSSFIAQFLYQRHGERTNRIYDAAKQKAGIGDDMTEKAV